MINRKACNFWVARVVPLVLVGIAVYGSYVVIGQVGVAYLLAPQQNGFPQTEPRPGVAITVIVIFSILMFLVAITYFRILGAVIADPGYVPRGPNASPPARRSMRRRARSKNPGDVELGDGGSSTRYEYTVPSSRPSPASAQPGLVDFYSRDLFLCEGDGRPPWCTTCAAWKPDRSHHCREVNRCVRKMDHFCPWVGGVVSETNFKFFIQFNVYTVLICIYSVVVLAFFMSEQVQVYKLVDVHYPICMAFVGLFGLFCTGMSVISIRFAFTNLTSVEDLSARVKVWSVAVYLPDPPAANGPRPPYQTITYPLVIDADAEDAANNGGPSPRTFAILHSQPGEHPFDLGPSENFKSVMGYTLWDWLLPLRRSPCCDHSGMDSAYVTGPVMQQMKERAGLLPAGAVGAKPSYRRRRRRSHGRQARREAPETGTETDEAKMKTAGSATEQPDAEARAPSAQQSSPTPRTERTERSSPEMVESK